MREKEYIVHVYATDPNENIHTRSVDGYSRLGDMGVYVWALSNLLRVRRMATDLRKEGFKDIGVLIEKKFKETETHPARVL